jgi:ribonuclease Z
LYVEFAHERGASLFDLGDLAALSSRELLRVTHVFLSHMHMDHFIGFDTLLRVHIGRDKLITLVGPDGNIDCVASKLAGYTWDLVGRYAANLAFDVIEMVDEHRARRARFDFRSAFAMEPLRSATVDDGVVVSTPEFQVSAAVLEHHGPCLGFTVSEPVRINVWRNLVQDHGLPLGAWLKTLKAAVRDRLDDAVLIPLPNGENAPLGTLRELVSMTPGQRIGYVTDIRNSPGNMKPYRGFAPAPTPCSSRLVFRPAKRSARKNAAILRRQRQGGWHELPTLAGWSHSTSHRETG